MLFLTHETCADELEVDYMCESKKIAMLKENTMKEIKMNFLMEVFGKRNKKPRRIFEFLIGLIVFVTLVVFVLKSGNATDA